MNKKILILGKGFIGERLQKEFGCAISGEPIKSFADAEKIVRKYNPKVIINCIGVTGKRNVDDCELDQDATLLANSFVPLILAEIALRNNIKLVHISSGCIYHYDYKKNSPLSEDKIPDYLDLFYSRSKIYADLALGELSKKYNILICRIRIPLLNEPHPKNILDKLIKYGKVITLKNSVTYIPDFIRALKHLIKIDAKGIYNVVNKGGLSYPKLMEVYKKYVFSHCEPKTAFRHCEPRRGAAIPSFNYKTIDFRKLGLTRTNLLMSTRKLEQTGFKVRPIDSVLEECVKDYLKY